MSNNKYINKIKSKKGKLKKEALKNIKEFHKEVIIPKFENMLLFIASNYWKNKIKKDEQNNNKDK